MTSANIAVVGTGVVGLAVAHALLGRGHTVAICGPRPGPVPGQASGAAGAMLSIFSEVDTTQSDERADLEVTQRLHAFARYPAWLDSLTEAGGDPVALVDGTWVVAGHHELGSVDAIARAATNHGHAAELHTRPDITGMRPDTAPAAALWLPTEPSLDITRLLATLGTAVANRRNAHWHRSAAELHMTERAARIHCVDGTAIACDYVVLAAGIGIPVLLGERAAELGVPTILAGRGASMVLRTSLPIAHTIRTPNTAFACGTHLVPRGPATAYVGATNRLTLTPDPTTVPTLDEINALITEAMRLVDHRLGAAELVATQVGYRPYTLDHLPLIGPTADRRVLLATGTYRCGVLLAPLLAERIADAVHDPAALDMHPYRVSRPMPAPRPADMITSAHLDGLVEHLVGSGRQVNRANRSQLAALIAAAIPSISSHGSRLIAAAPVPEVLPSLLALIARLETQPCPSSPIPPPRSSTQPTRSSAATTARTS